MVEQAQALPVETIGENPTRLWGLTMPERVRRIARAAGLATSAGAAPGPRLLANAAFAFDPSWLREFLARPGAVLTLGGVPALAHARDAGEAARIGAAMRDGAPLADAAGLEMIAFEDGPTIENKQLRKRETPFLMPLRPDTVRALERASYFGAYKGVTDLLTKYLWPEWALVLTRIAAKLGITPNMVTAAGALLCVIATWCFADGRYWLGMALGLVFMVFDTVDGKLARCTITSSKWGNVFDHGIDLVHPPFWWWFWATGLATWGLAYDTVTFWWVQGAIQGGYLVQRLIEGVFMRQNGMMHIHVWRRFDSRFRLITARRNPNMVILFVATLLARPDLGLIAVAWWTAISCVVHAVRLVQAWIVRARGGTITSWLAEG
ncbi:CDP-alcohol phosphatidyltransferase family protein [Novosphingobium album (ex Liu et al. 2023)]|uniref:CDP-alcohol phosphatidyltransferase family protein n=1 Tax=Novosphingobium album (ex Liu et al. 2023) TaxID=3031130 RepID=A0ABT5WV20_9SPHN|nr:CDP-alcohol phosphatidyltransferase family protein [Novosphingobium album (ex Liu et al. 2023)]MDE8653755.1 CDP-alcohol phosphatidyltransferase family protein [Novosphingobium album (ex Liu et al. 2023)]